MGLRAAFRCSTRFAALAAAAAALLLGGCEAVFTYSPLSGLQRPPSSMTPAQRLTYAEDALASGDQAAMKGAYDAIKNDSGADAQYLTAQLGIELSGVPDVLVQIASDPSTVSSQLNTIDAFITAHNLDPAYMVAAAAQLAAAKAAGAVLTTMDYAMGSMGLLLGAAYANSGSTSWDITAAIITNADRDAAGYNPAQTGFLTQAVLNVASLPSGDPLKDFITQLDSFISGL
jgi:hypothetical protein